MGADSLRGLGSGAAAAGSGTTVQLAPPYSCTRERALYGAGSTVTVSAGADPVGAVPSAGAGSCRPTGPAVRTIAWRPPSVAMPSVHHTWSPTRCGEPRRVPPVARSSAVRGEGQEPYGSVVTMRSGYAVGG